MEIPLQRNNLWHGHICLTKHDSYDIPPKKPFFKKPVVILPLVIP